MKNLWKLGLVGLALSLWTADASAISINKCAQMLTDKAGRQTIFNRCTKCITVSVERRRPGNSNSIPNMRTYNIGVGSKQPLPFRGPGLTRITNETVCPQAVR
ncbi:hypothetical protein V5T82_03960 [Magnetovibrio sp. PR-2]|uniref:hypothetical protein n=1 Tax=Magnetovibrio sp. PR-2 TaxID=3120356 RepID=UPI002FCE2CC7